jgi:hypothetical protein
VLRKISEMSRPLVWRLSGVLRYAPRMWRWEILSRLAADIGVTAMAVQTTDGLILTKVQDRTFLPYLAKIGSNAAHQNIVYQCKQVLKDGGTYFDIGANVGLTTIPLGGVSNVTIHAFEPDPANFRMLVTNLSINCPGHKVSLHEVALGDENGLAAAVLDGVGTLFGQPAVVAPADCGGTSQPPHPLQQARHHPHRIP